MTFRGGGTTEEDAAKFKEESIKILSEVGFTSYKWHSNVENLNSVKQAYEEETYAKNLVGNKGNSTTKIREPRGTSRKTPCASTSKRA